MNLPLRAWKEVLATFGISKAKKSSSKQNKKRGSRSRQLESLEDRRMMAVLYWDPNHTATGSTLATLSSAGGTGSWNTSAANWYNLLTQTDQAWNNSNGDTAVFTGTAGTVTAASGISAGEVDFSTTGYALQSGSLAISGSGKIDVAAGLSDSISSTLNGSNGLTKTSSGTLIGTGTNTYSGGTTIDTGTLQIGNTSTNGTIGSGNYSIVSGARLYLDYATASAPTWSDISGAGEFELNSAQAVNGTANWGVLSLGSGFTGTLQLDNGLVTTTPTGLGNTTSVIVNSGAQFMAYDGTLSGTAYTFDQNFSINGLGWGLSGYNLGALRVAGMNATFAGNITLTGNSGLFTGSAGNATMDVSGSISGGYGLTINAAGNPITLSGADTFSGSTTVGTGTLVIANANALQDSTLTTAGIVFSSSVSSHDFTFGGLSGSGNIVLHDNAGTPNAVALTVGNDNANTTYSGVLSGTGSLIKSGTAILTVTGANTYSGGTTIDTGTLKIGNASTNGTIGSGAYNIASGARLYLDYATASAPTWSDISGAGEFELNSAQAVNGTANWGVLSLGSGFTGTLQLDNGLVTTTPTGLGNTTSVIVNSGAQFMAYDGTLSGTAYTFDQNFSINGLGWGLSGYNLGALRVAGMNATFAGNITLTGNSGLFTGSAGNATMDVSGSISGGYGLTINAAGNPITLSSANTYSGGTTISEGTLQLGDGSISNGSVAGNITDNSVLVFANPSAETYGGVISGSGSLTESGPGTLSLTGANTFSGNTSVTAGALTIANANALQDSTLTTGGIAFDSSVSSHNFTFGGLSGSGSIALQDNAGTPNAVALTVGNNNASTTYTGVLSGAGSLIKSGTGILTVTGANTYSGGTTIDTGTLQIGNASTNGTIGSGNYSIASGTRLYLDYATASAPTWSDISGAGKLDLNSAQAVNGTANWGVLSLGFGFTGTLQLDNGLVTTTPTGLGNTTSVIVNSGAQFMAYDGTLSGTAYTFDQNFSINGLGWGLSGYNLGALRVAGMNATFAGNITLTGNSGLFTGSAGNATMDVSGNISGAFGLTINAAGNPITLSGDDTYTGTTTVATGALVAGATDALSSSSAFVVNGTLDLGGYSQIIGSLGGSGAVLSTASSGNAVLTFGGKNTNTTFSGDLWDSPTGSGTLGLDKVGSGTTTLSGYGSNTGAFDVNDGTMNVTGEMFSPFFLTPGGTLKGTGDTGWVTNNGGTYVANLYIVTIPPGTPASPTADTESALHGNAAAPLYNGSLSYQSGVGDAVFASSAEDAVFKVVTGSITITVDNPSSPQLTYYTTASENHMVAGAGGGSLPKPAFKYNPTFSVTDSLDPSSSYSGQAIVLEDAADFAHADYDYNDDYFPISVTEESIQFTCIPCQQSQLSANGGGNTAPDQTAGGITVGGIGAFGSPSAAAALNSDNGGTSFSVPTLMTNNAVADSGSNGNGATSPSVPKLLMPDASTVLIIDGTINKWFELVGGSYEEQLGGTDTLTYDSSSDQFSLAESTGETEVFHGFNSPLTMAQRGTLVSITAPGGGSVSVADTNSDGQPTEIQSSSTTNGVTTTDTYEYTYLTSGPNTGLVSNVTLSRQVGSASPSAVQQIDYTYYDGTDYASYGNAGDLMLSQIEDGSGNVIDTTYYRYYTTNSSVGYTDGLEYMFSNASYNRLLADEGGTASAVLSASNTTVAPYADEFLQYNAQMQITQLVSQGTGCSVCTAGLGTYTYSYSQSSNVQGYNNWTYETVETQPNGTQNTFYSNYAGEILLEDQYIPSTGEHLLTDYQYDSSGRLIETANPSAVVSYNAADANLGVVLNSSSGLIDLTDYYSSTSSGAIVNTSSTTTTSGATAGGVAGYVEDTKIENGTSGTPILESTTTYFEIVGSNGAINVEQAANTVYSTATATGPSSAGAETTTDAYTFYSGTVQVEQDTTSLPAVTDQNTGHTSVTDSTTTVYDQYGNAIWQKDPNGSLSYTAYDQATGAVIESIQDVNTASIPSGSLEASTLPSGWTTPTGYGLNLITTYQVDALGRTVEETDPKGDVTFTVYNDPDQEVRTYSGWTYDSGTDKYVQMADAPPTQVERTDLAGNYYETLTMSATPDVDPTTGAPTGAEAIADVQSLSRSIMNSAGQVVETDAYYNLTTNESTSSAWTYSTTAQIGTAWNPASPTTAANYYKTTTQYNDLGDVDKTVDADGNITRTVYDGLGRETSVWVGTNDTPTSGYWSPTNNTGSSNMVEISASVYDNGGMGDGNLTESISFPSGNGAAASTFRVTEMLYDWQDRAVATKSGALVTEVTAGTSGSFAIDGLSDSLLLDPSGETSDGVNRSITYNQLDNLGETTAEAVYAGDGVTLSYSGGVPVAPSSSLMRSLVFTTYDTQGRQEESAQYSVDQSSGISGYTLSSTPPSSVTNLVSSTLYDADGNTLETDVYDVDLSGTALNTQTTTFAYDGADRQTSTSQPDPESDDGSTTPGYLTTATTYDGDGNVLTETDPMGNVTTYIYDAANRQTAVYQPNPDDGSGPSTFTGLSTTNPETICTYDTAGNQYTVEEPNGTVTTCFHDALGRQTEIEQADPVTDGSDGNANTSDYSVLVTSYAYDGNSNVLTVTDPMGHVTSYGYDMFGNRTSVTLPSITVTGTDGTGSSSTSPETESGYDNLGEMISTTDANGRETTFSYNVLGEQILQTDAGPGTDDPTIGTPTLEAASTTTTTYDTLGGVLTQADTLGDTTVNTYDGFHHLASVTNPDGSGNTTSFSYDAMGNLLSESDADSNTTSYTYDSLNRQTSQSEDVALSYSGGTETDGTATTSYVYDADSNLTETIDADGHAIVNAFDHLNRESHEMWFPTSADAAADVGATNTINYGYNLAGQVLSAYDSTSGYSYSYDSLGRLTQIDNLGGETDGTPGVPDVQLNISYYADGSQMSLSATIGGTADFLDTYQHNAAGWLTSITQQGQTGGNTVAGENVTFNHDASGETTGEGLYQSADTSTLVATETSAYDGAGRLEGMTYVNGSTTLDSFNYTYDSANRVYRFADAQHTDEDVIFGYDAASQLTSATPSNMGEASNASNSYSNSYDPNGNAASVDAGSTVTGLGNRLLSDGTWNYAYDLNGNMISQSGISGGSAAGQEIDYTFDVMNRLTDVDYYTDSVQTLAIGYTYDMRGQLLSRTQTPYVDGIAGTPSTANYVYGPNGNMALAFVNGSLTDRYLSGPAIDQIIADDQLTGGEHTWWAATDNQGTVKDLLEYNSGTGTISVASHLAYSPFGNLDTADSTGLDVATVDYLFGYTGTWTDPVTGLQWHNDPSSLQFGRWYNADIQQWMGQDPSGLDVDPNLYRYVGNNPADATDPSGLAPPSGPVEFLRNAIGQVLDRDSRQVLSDDGNYGTVSFGISVDASYVVGGRASFEQTFSWGDNPADILDWRFGLTESFNAQGAIAPEASAMLTGGYSQVRSPEELNGNSNSVFAGGGGGIYGGGVEYSNLHSPLGEKTKISVSGGLSVCPEPANAGGSHGHTYSASLSIREMLYIEKDALDKISQIIAQTPTWTDTWDSLWLFNKGTTTSESETDEAGISPGDLPTIASTAARAPLNTTVNEVRDAQIEVKRGWLQQAIGEGGGTPNGPK